MFANDLVLDSASGVDTTYRLFRSDATGSQRIDISTDLRAPAILKIAHSTSGKGDSAVDRHLVQLVRNVVSSTGILVPFTINVTSLVPRNTAVTSAMIKDGYANIIDFLADGQITTLATTANIDALLRGEA